MKYYINCTKFTRTNFAILILTGWFPTSFKVRKGAGLFLNTLRYKVLFIFDILINGLDCRITVPCVRTYNFLGLTVMSKSKHSDKTDSVKIYKDLGRVS